MPSYFALVLAVALFQADDRLTFTCPEGNYKLTYSDDWSTLKPPEEFVQFAIQRRNSLIMFSGIESNATVEDLIGAMETAQKMRAESVLPISRQETQVGGERAVRVQLEAKLTGVRVVMFLTAFTHQGFAYRVMGVRLKGADNGFDQDYRSILKEFSFLEERKEWLAKFEGKPARTALLGGLAAYELNRPRWMETTFENNSEDNFFDRYNLLDRASYQFFPGGAWVHLHAREAIGDAVVEKEELRRTLSAGLQNTETRDATAGRKKLPCLEVTGSAGEVNRVRRGAVCVTDGIAVQFWVDSVGSQREAVRRDWDQLADSFRLQRQSMPDEPPAFPCRPPAWTRTTPDAGLAVFLSQATRIVSGEKAREVLAISSDGKSAAVRGPDGISVEGLATHKRQPLGGDFIPGRGGLWSPNVAWSPDGKRVAYATDEDIVVVALEPKETRRIPARAAELAFGPSGDDILICTKEPTATGRFVPSRLERVKLADGSRQALVDFPLCRVAHPVVSPNGRWIALVSNRNYPRTAAIGGHLYLCAGDGSGLRQLTHDPEEIKSVAWSPDGKHLYATRRLAVGDDGAAGPGGSGDLFRISPETGKAKNLTRSGRIDRIWCADGDLLLEVTAWDVPSSQRGIFRIAAEQLEKATASRPVRPIPNPRAQVNGVIAKVLAAVGETSLKNVLPTPALLEKAAQGFADGVKESFGENLDFSATSLDRLATLLPQMDLASGRHPGIVFGVGAYYGETLRKLAGAQWRVRPLRFGEWTPARQEEAATPLAEVVLPFSEPYRFALHAADEGGLRRGPDVLDHKEGQKLVLVYPPAYAEEALREATGATYYEALKMLDAGEVKPALEILGAQMQRRPKNRALAREIIALCEAARMPEAANELTRKAVEAGNEVPELLLRYADLLAKNDPKLAFRYYRQAVQGEQAPAEAFIKLGQQFSNRGQTAVAESCWRRAYANATEPERRQIRKLMGLPDETGNKGVAKASND